MIVLCLRYDVQGSTIRQRVECFLLPSHKVLNVANLISFVAIHATFGYRRFGYFFLNIDVSTNLKSPLFFCNLKIRC